jgi:hypothetical protein
MLLRYFGFRGDPFGATPDPRFLYRSHTHREALACLQYGFYNNRGFTALIAPPINSACRKFRHNPELIDPDDIQPGQKIRLPGSVAENATPSANVRNLP